MAAVYAQDARFIYIQNETKQPFFVKIDAKVLHSSATGYLIIPKITNSNNKLTIGFPKNEWPQLNVTVNLHEAENGYVLKNVKGKGWSLIDMQTAKVAVNDKPAAVAVKKPLATSVNANEFARILAEVVNDPSIAEISVVNQEAELPINKTVEAAKAPQQVTNPEMISVAVEPENESLNNIVKQNESPNVQQAVVKAQHASATKNEHFVEKVKTPVAKLAENATNSGLMISYLDKTETDTINIFIPVAKPLEVVAEVKKEPVVQNTMLKTENAVTKVDVAKKDVRFLDMELRNPNLKEDSGAIVKDDFVIREKRKTIDAIQVAEQENLPGSLNAQKVMINSDCKKMASQNDFLLLQKKMAVKSEDNEMLKLANKDFLKICFSSEQIRKLSTLFNNEEGRYKFLVAAFPHVSDSDNYDALEVQLTDDYYKTRFKAMVSQ